jgi:FAD/FMN-containing dehydrogenase
MPGALAGCLGGGKAGSNTTSRRRTVPVTQPRRPTLRDLARELHGPLLRPEAHDYADIRRVYNSRYENVRPRAVAVAVSEHDVRACVRWAARSGSPISIRSGGHSYAGYSTTSGLVCDVRRLRRIATAPSGRTVIVGAGALLIDVVGALAARGLAIPAGSCPTVGIGGLALGGGVGLAARAFGTTSDNVLALRVVTADGRLVEATPVTHPDLYWACRGGGGGNFGAVTALTLGTHPVGDVAYAFCNWPWSQAAAAVAAWQALAPQASDQLSLICTLATDPAGVRVRVFGQLLGGSESDLRAMLAPLAAVPGATVNVGSASYLDAQRIWAGCAGESEAVCRAFRPTSFAARSDYVARPLSADAIATMVAFVEQRQPQAPDGVSAMLLDPYGGAINQVPSDATAFVHRAQLFSCQYLAYWSHPREAGAAKAWLDAFHAAMRPHVSGQAYQNYIDPSLRNWEQAYYGSNLARLREVKRAYDPDGLFRFRQSIRA